MLSRSFLTRLLGAALALLPALAYAQQPAPPKPATITLSGYVRDAATGESLIGAAVVRPAAGGAPTAGAAANPFGFYSLTLPAVPGDTAIVVATFVGYQRVARRVVLDRSQAIDFRLPVAARELGEATVEGRRDAPEGSITESTRMGTITVPVAQLKQVPALFGERDVLRVLQLLPGVQKGGEGQTGLYVRGGSPDQNLMLLDGTPVYNASHLFGFFSVFNADALNNVELIKGGFPARYGGRLSSVVDLTMKEGNIQKLHGEGGIGVVGARLTLDGPIGRKKALAKDSTAEAPASFLVSGRRTYIDILARPLIAAAAEGNGTAGYFFHDFNAKLNWRVNRRDRLYLSAYTGYDKFYARFKDNYDGQSSTSKNNLGWGNLTTALRWNRQLADKLFLNTHLTYSKYQFNIGAEQKDQVRLPDGSKATETFTLRYLSNIKDWSVKSDLDYVPTPNHYVRTGAQVIWHQFRPGALIVKDDRVDGDFELESIAKTQSVETGLYVEDDWRLTDRLKANIGFRLSGCGVGGQYFASPEPRVSARYFLTEDWAVKAAYARTTQYIHLLTNSGIGLPTDLWVPATPTVKPQRAQQLSLGAARTFTRKGESYELSLESYYKPMFNLIEYQEGASFLGTTDNAWQNKVTSGRGWAYGAEVFVQKKTGRTTGWIGYTLAWSRRKFAELNQGQIYPYKYDRRHDLSVVVIHEFNPRMRLSGTFVYGTGNAITLSRGRYQLGGYEQFEDYGPRNSYRMPAYHRVDLDLSITKKKKWGTMVNSFSLYNAYSRRNPFYMYFDPGYSDNNGNVIKDPTYRLVSLFPIIPSFSKSFQF